MNICEGRISKISPTLVILSERLLLTYADHEIVVKMQAHLINTNTQQRLTKTQAHTYKDT